MRTVRFGIVGCGLMGREFGSAAARFCHLPQMPARPELVAVCDTVPGNRAWFTDNFPTVTQATDDYRQLLANPAVEALYVAVPHHLHQELYCAAIRAGKHLMGEKPFGIDKPANDAILAAVRENPRVFVRCSSEFPFYPAVQRIGRLIETNAFGRLLEVTACFLHSSDLNVEKPINWKRTLRHNGEYGCMGDLGMHVCHVPFRAGWRPVNVRAILSNVVPQRPDGKGGQAPCETWDNATLLCEAADKTGDTFPMTLKTQRIAPGETNSWSIEIKGMKGCARFSTKNPRRLDTLAYSGGEQLWQRLDVGHEMAYPSVTGGIFEAGFSDVVLQMWAAFLYELVEGRTPSLLAGCVTPGEVALSHRLFTAALESQRRAAVVAV